MIIIIQKEARASRGGQKYLKGSGGLHFRGICVEDQMGDSQMESGLTSWTESQKEAALWGPLYS
jgi:hypothetical protein